MTELPLGAGCRPRVRCALEQSRCSISVDMTEVPVVMLIRSVSMSVALRRMGIPCDTLSKIII